MKLNEKLGGKDRNLSVVTEFREIENDYNLVDLGCKDYPFYLF